MPIYEFECLKCGKTFEDLFSGTSATPGTSCPYCKSSKVKKLLSSFSATTKSGDFACNNPGQCPSARSCGGTCGMNN